MKKYNYELGSDYSTAVAKLEGIQRLVEVEAGQGSRAAALRERADEARKAAMSADAEEMLAAAGVGTTSLAEAKRQAVKAREVADQAEKAMLDATGTLQALEAALTQQRQHVEQIQRAVQNKLRPQFKADHQELVTKFVKTMRELDELYQAQAAILDGMLNIGLSNISAPVITIFPHDMNPKAGRPDGKLSFCLEIWRKAGYSV
jgi:chromosome segregation ATPase